MISSEVILHWWADWLMIKNNLPFLTKWSWLLLFIGAVRGSLSHWWCIDMNAIRFFTFIKKRRSTSQKWFWLQKHSYCHLFKIKQFSSVSLRSTNMIEICWDILLSIFIFDEKYRRKSGSINIKLHLYAQRVHLHSQSHSNDVEICEALHSLVFGWYVVCGY